MDVEDEASRCTIQADNNSRSSGNRESRGDENRQGKSTAECWYCGKKGHRESECWKKCADLDRIGSGSGFGHTDKGNRQRSHYAEGSGNAGKGSSFVTRHEANSMKQTIPKSEEVWYVDSGASNHIMSHGE